MNFIAIFVHFHYSLSVLVLFTILLGVKGFTRAEGMVGPETHMGHAYYIGNKRNPGIGL